MLLGRPIAQITRSGTLLAYAGLGLACSTGQIDDETSTFDSLNTTANDEADRGTDTDTGHGETGGSDEETGEPAPTCGDGLANQGETDIDCGGPNCGPCGDGQGCAQNSDCVSQSCASGLCIQPSCGDGVTNADETDVDCGGGTCDPCSAGFVCG